MGRSIIFRLLAVLIVFSTLLAAVQPAGAAPWANRSSFVSDRFESVWRRSDDPSVRSGRGLYWGFAPWFDYFEFYRESENGLRQVQYFDKARMEINHASDQAVTNGLLVVELVSGQLKLGDDPYAVSDRGPATLIPVAGDGYASNGNSPSYASFKSVSTVSNNGYTDPDRRDQSVGDVIDRAGNRTANPTLLSTYREQTRLVTYNTITGHNIATVFWDFLNLQGPVVVNGQRTTGPVVDWVSAMGYPITDPYWVRAKVGGVEKDVLVQLFERRILTYTPTNEAAYQVEMGNVGQHYFQWRYPHLGLPWNSAEPVLPIAFASKRDGGPEWDAYTMNEDGSSVALRGSNNTTETVPYSWLRSWDPIKTTLFVDSRQGNGSNRQIWSISSTGLLQRITWTDGTPPPPMFPYQGYIPAPANDWNPAVSPDGTKLAFVSDRGNEPGVGNIWLSLASGASPVPLTTNGCYNSTPTWASTGRYLYWEADCGGNFNIYRADLSYQSDSSIPLGNVYAELRNIVNLTSSTTSDNRFPRVSPDGRRIVFTSNRDGNFEIYLMNADGTSQTRLTTSSGDDMAPSWKLDGTRLAFDSYRDGNWNVYTMSLDGSSQTQLTNSPSDDRWNIWGQ